MHSINKIPRAYDWKDVVSIRICVPTSRFRYMEKIALFATVATATALMGDPGITPREGTVIVKLRGGSTLSSPLTRHHIWGYWEPTVSSAQTLVQLLIEVPESRGILGYPDDVVQAVARTCPRSVWDI